MSHTDSGTHWLAVFAEFAGLKTFPLSHDPALTELAEAWEQVTLASGMTDHDLLGRVIRHFRAQEASLGASQGTARALVPAEVARRFGILPLRLEEDTLVVATSDPSKPGLVDVLRQLTSGPITLEVAAPTPLCDAIELFYTGRATSGLEGLVAEAAAELSAPLLGGAARWGNVFSEDLDPDPPSIVALCDALLETAVEVGASDLHLDPPSAGGTVRFRVDGMLREVQRLPKAVADALVSRLRAKCGLSAVSEGKRDHGVGRLTVAGEMYTLKLVSTPTAEGDKVSVALAPTDRTFRIEDLDLTSDVATQVQSLVSNPAGLFLISGPTGSGVTSLVYSILTQLAQAGASVSTLENPIEFDLPGISQRRFRGSDGREYADVLYEVLGQDTDVLFAGEARDSGTARAALRASVTGRRVYTTLHTRDAIGALERLVQMGVEGREVADGVRGVIAQRLLRRLCVCARPVNSVEDLSEREQSLARHFQVKPGAVPIGCDRCSGTGYRGLVPVTEVLEMTSEIAQLLAAGEALHKVEAMAIAGGMRLLVEQGLTRAEAGETTLQEVERILGTRMPQPRQGTQGVPSTVLVIDDSIEDRALIRAILEKKGLRVLEAEDAIQAERTMAEEKISLVLLDLRLPGADGLSLLKRMRQTSGAPANMPVVVLTSSQNPDDEISLLRAGADDYILKPIDPRRLSVRVDTAFRRIAATGGQG